MITGTTKLLGVIGHPVKHSLSPVMHNAAITHLKADYVYVPLPIQPDALKQAIDGFEAIALHGFSVTIPHKQLILPLLSEISPIAQAVGAVNTVCRTKQGWVGTNTDVTGFLAPLRAISSDWSQTAAVILGNGGAARAVVAGCAQLGVGKVQVVGRNLDRLNEFAQSWKNSSVRVNLSVHARSELSNLLPQADLLVNTTPIGMHPNINESPLTLTEMQTLKRGAIAYDLIYTPSPTRFLEQAQAQGAVAIDGLEMLIWQGAAALELWLQQPAPIEVMRRSLRQHLGLETT